MRHVLRAILIVPLLLVAADASRAQPAGTFSDTKVFSFSRVPSAEVKDTVAELKLRPNTATELFLWVLNPTENDGTFIVEVTDANGTLSSRAEVKIPGNARVPVRFPKPAPPPAPTAPVPPPAVPGGAAPAPAPEPPPPGVELPQNNMKLTFRLLKANGDELRDGKDGKGKPYGAEFSVGVLTPQQYVSPDAQGTLKAEKAITEITLAVKQSSTAVYPGTATIQLAFPPQPAMERAVVRDGFYRRTLTFDKDGQASVTLAGKIQGADTSKEFTVYVGVDGVDRAFKYTPNPKVATQLTRTTDAAIRVFPASPKQSRILQPTGKFPVRVEVDNPETGDRVEVFLRPVGGGTALTETVRLDGPRDEHVWLETAGPGGGLLFTTRSRDWVQNLDLSNLQGPIEVTAALLDSTGKQRAVTSLGSPVTLVVDGTPPENIGFLRLPNPLKVEKGKPLTVVARVEDPETEIVKAEFFLAKNLDEGKMPADAIKAVGRKVATFSIFGDIEQRWAGDLKIPDDFRGPGVVGVIFTNKAGVSNTLAQVDEIQRIEIVDALPKPPLGSVKGKVLFGDRPQPGVAIKLFDPDGKEKGGATTDDKGVFLIKNVAPGPYTVAAAKKDSSTGASGTAPVTVEADKVAEVVVTLSKNRL